VLVWFGVGLLVGAQGGAELVEGELFAICCDDGGGVEGDLWRCLFGDEGGCEQACAAVEGEEEQQRNEEAVQCDGGYAP